MSTQERIRNLESEVDRLWTEIRRLDKRVAGSWDRAMSQRRIGDVLGAVLAMPALRGAWLMSSFEPSGDVSEDEVKDQSGQDRTLTTNDNPQIGEDAFLPYVNLDGSTQYLSRADEAMLDIRGNETTVLSAQRGLTIGVVCYFDNEASAREAAITKGGAGTNNTAYWIERRADGLARFLIADGSKFQYAQSTVAVGAGEWTSFIGRFDPSTEVALFVNDLKYTDTEDIPATLLDATSAFVVGACVDADDYYMDGRVALVWICAACVRDAVLMKYYGRLKPFLG
jgi:hypothetical protein